MIARSTTPLPPLEDRKVSKPFVVAVVAFVLIVTVALMVVFVRKVNEAAPAPTP
jgi:hypothetical protein